MRPRAAMLSKERADNNIMSPLGYVNHQVGFELGLVFGKDKKFEDPWTFSYQKTRDDFIGWTTTA